MKHYFIYFSCFLFLSGHSFAQTEITPTILKKEKIVFEDDMMFENLHLAIDRQLESYDINGLKGYIKFGTKVYDKKVLRESLVLFKQLTSKALSCMEVKLKKICMDQFNVDINSKFALYVPAQSRRPISTKFTSYFSPDLHGSRTRTERFSRAIYRVPDAPHDNYTRVEIDYKAALIGKGYEIFWVEESFFDLYLLHVQGGGRINISKEDGSSEVKYLSYAGRNTHPFRMISRYMISKGYLTEANKGIEAQRKFLKENPHKEEEIFNSSPSYIYFVESDKEPVGLDEISLTEGRSVAIDSKIYKTTGLITFVKTQKAIDHDSNGNVIKAPFSRFFIAQDTGGAIRGSARCDLYFGYGPMAEKVAYNMDDMGEQYFLIKK